MKFILLSKKSKADAVINDNKSQKPQKSFDKRTKEKLSEMTPGPSGLTAGFPLTFRDAL